MYPLNDNDLDRLGREAAEQYDVDQNPSTSGWEALEGRLNKEMPVDEKKRRRFLFWLVFMVATAGGGLWYIMSGNNTEAGQIAHVATVPGSTNKDAKNNPLPGDKISPNPVINEQEAGTATQPPAAPAASEPQQQAKQKAVLPVTAGAETALAASRNNKAANKKNNNKPQRTSKQKVEHAPKEHEDDFGIGIGKVNDKGQPVANTATKNDNDNSSNQTDTAAVATVTDPQPAPIPAKDTTTVAQVKQPAKDTTAVAQAKQPAKKTDNKKNRGLEIGLLAGPDASNVKFYNAGRVGYNAGLQLGYHFSDRWSVNTGVIYTKKNYVANGDDVAKYGYFTNPSVKMNTMEGYCSMWDFPINVRYDFARTAQRRFFVSTGLSTYLMKRENYDYYYSYNNGPEQTYNWDSKERGEGTSTYLFSILNLSAGFERTISKKFSLQAEPYFKLPLSQLGHGKLNLNSYGIYFSVKYRITK